MINKLFLLLISCGSGSSTPTPQVEKQSLSLTYSFSESAQGFSIDTADYSVEHPQNDIIKSEMSDLPPPYEFRKGILYQWNNYSDDMKGYIKKKITGLNVNSQFQVDFKVDVLTSIPEGCVGAGGAPGESVRVKAALLIEEPVKKIDTTNNNNLLLQIYRISIDDGQSGGADVVLLGHIGLPIPCNDETLNNPVWEIKSLTNNDNFFMATNSVGEAWVYVSIDSGFEGFSTFYLAELELSIQEL